MERTIEKINQILKERKYDGIVVKDETDVIRLFERLITANVQEVRNNNELQAKYEMLSKDMKYVRKELDHTRRELKTVYRGETDYQEKLLKTAKMADNGGSIHVCVDLLRKIYRSLRNKFGREYFEFDENKVG